MKKSKALSIELDVNDIDLPIDFRKVNIGEVMTKYDFSIVDKSNEEKLLMVAKELLENNNILIGFACYNFNEIVEINNYLKNNNSSLTTIYIPSEERLAERMHEGKENARLHGRWIGSSEEEVEKNFENFRLALQKIKNGLKNTSIEIVEC